MAVTGATGAEPGASVLRLTFPAKPEYLVLGRLVLTGLSRAQPIGEDTLSDLKLALTEACSNSVRHAYVEGEDSGNVEVEYELGDDYLAVKVEDEGPGFEPDNPGAFDPESLDEGGLGLAIIRAIAEECEVRPGRDGRGSCVRFVLRLP